MYTHKYVLFVWHFQGIIFTPLEWDREVPISIYIWLFKVTNLRNHPTGIKWPRFLNMQSWYLIFKNYLIIEKKITLAVEILLEEGSHFVFYFQSRDSACHTSSYHTKHNHVQCTVTGVFEHLDSQIRVVQATWWYWEQTLVLVGVHLITLMYFTIYLETWNHSVVELPQKLLLDTILVNES